MRHRDRQERNVPLPRVVGADPAHQLLGDLGEQGGRRYRRRQGRCARHRAEVGKPHAHGHGPAGEGLGPEPGPDPVGEVQQRRPEHLLLERLPAERRLRAGGAGPAMRADDARIPIPRQRPELLSGRLADQALQRLARHLRQLPDGAHAGLGQPGPGDRANAPHQLDRQVVQESEFGLRIDEHQPVGLGHLRGDLGQVLGAGDAHRDRQSQLRPHAAADGLRDRNRRAEQVFGPCNVGEGFVDRDALDQRREVSQHLDGGVAQPLVFLEMTADEAQLRAEFPGLPARHPAAHAEGLGLIGGGQHDAAADGNGDAAQRRVEQLLDRGVEGVQIGVKDGSRFHPRRSPCSSPDHPVTRGDRARMRT